MTRKALAMGLSGGLVSLMVAILAGVFYWPSHSDKVTVFYTYMSPNQTTAKPGSMAKPPRQNNTPANVPVATNAIASERPSSTTTSSDQDASSLPVFNELNCGGGDHPGPKLHQGGKPKYPALAWEQGVEGRVTVKMTVNESGRITHVDTLQDTDRWGFVTAVRESLATWSFEPYRISGRPSGFIMIKTVEFVLE